jgi:hypothetical protein
VDNPPHTLRHFAVSFALSTGAKITEAAELARHSDPSVTARVYSHSLGGTARAVAEKVSAAFEEATNAGSTGNVTHSPDVVTPRRGDTRNPASYLRWS